MARFVLDYYDESDQYSDGDIEETIYKIVKEGRTIDTLHDDEKCFPVIYHLSPVRHNILSWYPFKTDSRILEVGSGCGAITGLLCKKSSHVTSVELSKRRASINYERNKDNDNLDIIVANLNNVKFEEKFDYIILNGVFEYAACYTKTESPYKDFLVYLSRWLNSDGTILIAIENRLGAKYFAGSPEDHIDRHFVGLNDYPGINHIKTFSKSELEEIVVSAGLKCTKFYYPYPDYKFPAEIFTDVTINSDKYGRPCYQFSEKKIDFIDESSLHKSFAKEKVADRFSNSFLIEVNLDEHINTESENVTYFDFTEAVSELNEFSINPIKINIERQLQRVRNIGYMYSKIYIDYGQGFSESNTKTSRTRINEDGSFCINYDISDLTSGFSLRWDPTEEPCKIWDVNFYVDNKRCDISPVGEIKHNGNEDYFMSDDPIYLIVGMFTNVKTIKITGKLSQIL